MIGMGETMLKLAGVPDERFGECLEWAFGGVNEKDSLDDLRRRWNKKHHYIFLVGKKDHPKVFLWSVGKAYMCEAFDSKKLILLGRGGLN